MSESSVGGFLNLREFQLVDCRFSKCELPSIGGHLVHHFVQTPALISHLASQREQHEVIESWSLNSVLLLVFELESPYLFTWSFEVSKSKLALDWLSLAFSSDRSCLSVSVPSKDALATFLGVSLASSLLVARFSSLISSADFSSTLAGSYSKHLFWQHGNMSSFA